MDTKAKLLELGVCVPNVLLPKDGFDKWAVVACDQFTSQIEYWQDVKEIIGDDPSAYNIILPEAYLETPQAEEHEKNIRPSMDRYLKEVLEEKGEGFVYLERKLGDRVRKGLIVALDLEQYDYRPSSKTLIRATEGTIIERVKPRLKIRKNATMEISHILVLIDDEKCEIVEGFEKEKHNHKKLYSTKLMKNGGEIEAYHITDEKSLEKVYEGLKALADVKRQQERYGTESPMLFAMGDGNHSFATAQAYWNEVKQGLSEEEKKTHPARYALVELVNIHEDALNFEPIHRAVFAVDAQETIDYVLGHYKKMGIKADLEKVADPEEMMDAVINDKSAHIIGVINNGVCYTMKIESKAAQIAVAALDNALDPYVKQHGIKEDYIHGEDVTIEIGAKKDNIGFILPWMDKNTFFKAVVQDGALPRKTFSLGHANEKRYYMEGKRI